MRPMMSCSFLLFSTIGLGIGLVPPATAAEGPDLEILATRLLANGDLLGAGHARNPDGTLAFTLVVPATFDAAAIPALGGTVDWAYPERGLALVRSADPAFGEELVAAGLATEAVARRVVAVDDLVEVGPAFDTEPWTFRHYVNGPDLYAENGLWWYYAIDAAEPVPSDTTVSGWTPEWTLAHDGTGVTVGLNDEGGPALWCDPMDVRIDLQLPLWGVCALWGTELSGEDCVFEDLGPVSAAGLCDDLGTLLDNPATLDGGTCALADQSLSELYALFYGYDYVNLDELSTFFRPRRLHPDFAWYSSPADADPTLGAPGGVLPFFDSLDHYRAFYEDRYMQALVPTGVAVVNEQLAFAGIEVALTPDFAAALEDGTAGACSTADARLPDPDSLDWTPYAYELFDPPFHRLGTPPQEGLNGYDADGELRVILDPNFGAVDLFVSAGAWHGTATASPISARYQPGEVYGTIRGLAPGARLISYPAVGFGVALANSFRRAGDDGVLILNNSWVSYDPFSHRANGLSEYPATAVVDAAEDLSGITLIVFSAANDAVDLNAIRGDIGRMSVAQWLPGALVVGGTAGRDYDWQGDIPAWMPDAPGQPYDAHRQAGNLDRPMIHHMAGTSFSGTNHGSVIDLVAPSGTLYYEEACPETDPDCGELYGDAFWFSWRFLEGEPGDPAGYANVGPHAASIGTSFSAPLVTGAGALAAQAYAEVHGQLPTPATLSRILTRGADDRVGPTVDLTAQLEFDTESDTGGSVTESVTAPVDKRGPDDWMGNGRLNVQRAIEEAQR